MCLYTGPISNTGRWNWEGDRIIFDAILPSGRPPVGRERPSYPIDVREFLVSEKNTVIADVLRKDLPRFFARKRQNPDRFTARTPGSFDFRAHMIAAFVGEHIAYESRTGRDPWQFPDETLFLRKGDCEDIAFLIASLMLASGISGYNIRVALGRLTLTTAQGRKLHHDHMWVMYRSEAGRWLVIEPLHFSARQMRRVRGPRLRARPENVRAAAYEPRFLFNQDHVWMTERDDRPEPLRALLERDWTRLNPKFAGAVHRTILNKALKGLAPDWVLRSLNSHFTSIFGNVVDEVDNFLTSGYDPRDHFDNAFVPEGWQRVKARLQRFKADNHALDDFAYAAHGIADFYAHSSYLHFAKLANAPARAGAARPCDPDDMAAGCASSPAYGAGTDFGIGAAPFTVNPTVYPGDPSAAPGFWNGKIISGRYAQRGDSHGLLEAPVYVPDSLIDGGFFKRGALPHHEEIAVDSEKRGKSHVLYRSGAGDPADRTLFRNQFRWRRNTAVLHIRAAFQENWSGT